MPDGDISMMLPFKKVQNPRGVGKLADFNKQRAIS